MPTTKEEAVKITEIFDEYISRETAREISSRLHNEVGRDSDNHSLKVSLEMLNAIYCEEARKKFVKKNIFWHAVLYFIVILHFAILLGNLIAIFVLPFLVSWYIALPVICFIITLAFSNNPCPLTLLEDYVRWNKLGKTKIKRFIGHYIVWPLRAYLNERRELQVK